MRKPRPVYPENLVQVTVHGVVHTRRIPRLRWPEPHPAGAAYERPNYNHQYPQPDEPHQESPNCEFPLLVGVVAVAKRIFIYIGYDHKPHNYEARHYHSCDPWIEIDEHFL